MSTGMTVALVDTYKDGVRLFLRPLHSSTRRQVGSGTRVLRIASPTYVPESGDTLWLDDEAASLTHGDATHFYTRTDTQLQEVI